MFILPTVLFIGFDTYSKVDDNDVSDQGTPSNTAILAQYSESDPFSWKEFSSLGNDVSFVALSHPDSGSPESLFAFACKESVLDCMSKWMALFHSSRRKESGVIFLMSRKVNQSSLVPLWVGENTGATRLWKVAEDKITCGSYKTVSSPSVPDDAPSQFYSKLSILPELSDWAGEVCYGSIQAFYLSIDLWTPFQDMVRQLNNGDHKIPNEISIPTILFLLEHLYD